MLLLLSFALLSILVSFTCSVLEAVLLSVTPAYLNGAQLEGKPWAKRLESYKLDIDKPLIAILTLNTMAHTIGAIGVGATANLAFGGGSHVVGIVSAVMTVLILVVSEIIPKTIGATYWQKLAGLTTRIIQAIIFPLRWSGLLWLLQIVTRMVGKDAHVNAVTREEIIAMTDAATDQGVFEESESQAIKNLLKFEQVLAQDIMSPRAVLNSADESVSVDHYLSENKEIQFSRIPVYQDNGEQMTGFVLMHDVMQAMIAGKAEMPLADLKRPLEHIAADLPMPRLFEQFLTQKEQIAVVVDAFGSVSGVVTMEDVIETLVGIEIVDETDQVVDLQKLARENWQMRADRRGVMAFE